MRAKKGLDGIEAERRKKGKDVKVRKPKSKVKRQKSISGDRSEENNEGEADKRERGEEGGKKEGKETYPNTPIPTPRNQKHIIELQTRHGSRMAHETPMYHSRPQIPQANHSIRCAARERRLEDL